MKNSLTPFLVDVLKHVLLEIYPVPFLAQSWVETKQVHVAEPNFPHVQDCSHLSLSLTSLCSNIKVCPQALGAEIYSVHNGLSGLSSATGVMTKMTAIFKCFSLSHRLTKPVSVLNGTIQINYFTHSNSAGKETNGKSKEHKDTETPKHRDAEKEPLPEWPDGVNPHTGEKGGPKGPEPTRYGDWERKGRVTDF